MKKRDPLPAAASSPALILVFVLTLATAAPALEYKQFVGLNWARYSLPPNPVAIPEVGFYLCNRTTPHIGAGFVYHINHHLTLDVSGHYFRKGTKVESRFWDEPIGTYTYDMLAISFPVCLRAELRPGSTPYALGGLEVSWILSHNMTYFPTGSTVGISQKLGADTRNIDFSAVFGGGGELVFGRWTIFAEVRWYYGLVNLSSSIADYPVIRTRAVALMAGIRTKRKRLIELP